MIFPNRGKNLSTICQEFLNLLQVSLIRTINSSSQSILNKRKYPLLPSSSYLEEILLQKVLTSSQQEDNFCNFLVYTFESHLKSQLLRQQGQQHDHRQDIDGVSLLGCIASRGTKLVHISSCDDPRSLLLRYLIRLGNR